MNPKPGLEPRKLEAEVDIAVESPDPSRTTATEQPAVESQAAEAVSENTEATPQAEVGNDEVAQEEQPLSHRANERIQSLAREKSQAEQRAAQAEAMLQRLVNAPNASPSVSDEELLAKQFKSYDANQGYPTDPREYVQYNQKMAALAAQKAALSTAQQQAEQADFGQMLLKHPDIANDTVIQGAVAAKRAEANRQGFTLSYTQAADLVKDELSKRYTKEATARQVSDTQDKNQAYVETTRGASPNRQPDSRPSADNMSLTEMEAYLKKNGQW